MDVDRLIGVLAIAIRDGDRDFVDVVGALVGGVLEVRCGVKNQLVVDDVEKIGVRTGDLEIKGRTRGMVWIRHSEDEWVERILDGIDMIVRVRFAEEIRQNNFWRSHSAYSPHHISLVCLERSPRGNWAFPSEVNPSQQATSTCNLGARLLDAVTGLPL